MKITVRAKPNSREEKVEKSDDGSFVVSVKEPPIEGMANKAIAKAIAKHFNAPIASVRVVSGHTSRVKIIEVK